MEDETPAPEGAAAPDAAGQDIAQSAASQPETGQPEAGSASPEASAAADMQGAGDAGALAGGGGDGAVAVGTGADAVPADAAPAGVVEGGWLGFLDLVDKGGPIVVILLVLSVFSLAIILLKAVQFARARLGRSDFVEPALVEVERGNYATARDILDEADTPLSRAMSAGVAAKARGDLRDEDVAAEVARAGAVELGGLQSFFRWLEVIGNVAPLLGLLGTVIGMIEAFQQLESSGNKVDPALLSGGIWEALLTTAVGLAVAIPAVTALNLFEGRIDRVRLSMRDGAARLIASLHARADRARAAE